MNKSLIGKDFEMRIATITSIAYAIDTADEDHLATINNLLTNNGFWKFHADAYDEHYEDYDESARELPDMGITHSPAISGALLACYLDDREPEAFNILTFPLASLLHENGLDYLIEFLGLSLDTPVGSL